MKILGSTVCPNGSVQRWDRPEGGSMLILCADQIFRGSFNYLVDTGNYLSAMWKDLPKVWTRVAEFPETLSPSLTRGPF